MALAPETDEEEASAEQGAKRRPVPADAASPADREAARLRCEVVRLREELRSERADHEHRLAVVSHELRTPISVVGGYLRLLLAEGAGPLSDEQQRFLSQAQRSCEKLAVLVKRLLESGPHAPLCFGTLEIRSSSLEPVFSDVADEFREALSANGLSLERDIDPAHRARFDYHAIERVLANLIDNAIRFAHRRIEVSTCQISESGRAFVQVAVTDDGPGIRGADSERIFAPFVRGEGPGSDGLGLGLALCQRLVEAHEGRIALVPSPTGGSRFVFTLPTEA